MYSICLVIGQGLLLGCGAVQDATREVVASTQLSPADPGSSAASLDEATAVELLQLDLISGDTQHRKRAVEALGSLGSESAVLPLSLAMTAVDTVQEELPSIVHSVISLYRGVLP